MGGQRSRTAWASFSPSMLPGMLTSLNSRESQGEIPAGLLLRPHRPPRASRSLLLDDLDSKQSQQWVRPPR
jgi:hypothetical protein